MTLTASAKASQSAKHNVFMFFVVFICSSAAWPERKDLRMLSDLNLGDLLSSLESQKFLFLSCAAVALILGPSQRLTKTMDRRIAVSSLVVSMF